MTHLALGHQQRAHVLLKERRVVFGRETSLHKEKPGGKEPARRDTLFHLLRFYSKSILRKDRPLVPVRP